MNFVFHSLSKDWKKDFYLSLLRVYLALHIIKKIILYFPIWNQIYGNDSFVVSSYDLKYFGLISLSTIRNYHHLFLFSVFILCLLFMFGIGRNVTVFLLYLAVDILQSLSELTLNGGDNLLKFILLYYIFINSFNYFTVSVISRKLPSWPTFISNLGVFSILFHFSIIYFLSGFHKIHSEVWFNGVATYYTLGADRFRAGQLNFILVKNGYFVTISTYITMLWELFFPLVLIVKRIRLPYLLFGVFLHLGIYILMMIHDFQILFIMLYGLFFSNRQTIKAFNIIASIFKFKTYEIKSS